MNIRDFEYLIAVDELKSFQMASKKCFISQPALSQQIKKIENQLGFEIFERSRKRIITTEKGEKVINQAKLILRSFSEIKEIAQNISHLKIALIPTICSYLLPYVVNKFKEELSDIKIFFIEEKTEILLKKLKEGEVDVGIIAYFDDLIDDKISYQKLYDEEFFLALNKKSKLTQKDFPQIMSDKKLILLNEGNCMNDNIKDICSLYKKDSFSDFYATNIETVKNMLKVSEDSAAILPRLACLNEKDLKLLSFNKKRAREIGIVTRNSYQNKDLILKISKIISASVS
jgi:LysR family transcriptional regulator, hydrogen peroxide-inducible genes activator